MRGRAATSILLTAVLAAVVALAVVASRGPDRPSTRQEQADAIASSLRCPVCQNLSVADSPSRLAADMRRDIATDLRAGKSPAVIRGEFVAAYGEWVLLSPPKRGINLVAWIAPAVLILAGAGAAVWTVRRWRRRDAPADAEPPTPEERALVDRALAATPEDRP